MSYTSSHDRFESSMPTVFVSDTIHKERLIFELPQVPVRQAPRGWKALSALYQASLAACQYPVQHVVRPEIYQTAQARKARGVEAGDWHLAVKPIEHLRPFHGIPNVFVCDWPFPELSAAPLGGSPFSNQVRLLKMAEAVLCCTDFTANTLRNAGIERVVTLPPYIPPLRRGRMASLFAQKRCSFLSVVDSDHLSRQLGLTIEGFAQAAATHSGLHLVFCLQGADEQTTTTFRQRVAQITAALTRDEIVSVVNAGADGAEAELCANADFFLCTESAAGLHLPLVEAMLAGMPLVTTISAGTASFVPADAVIPIATQRGSFDEDDEPIGRWLRLTAHCPTAQSVHDAVLAAAALDETARTRLAAIGREIAERRFGLAAFKAGLGRLSGFVSPVGQ